MKKHLLILFIFCSSLLYAQNNPDIKRTMHWYFGFGAGLDFTSGQPVVDTMGQTQAFEAVVTMSDTCGNLLFYAGERDDTSGQTVVWNKNHQVMQNGNITACCSTTQMVAVPQPGNDSIYYLFYNYAGGFNNGQFLYAVINMNANYGLGEVMNKNIVLIDSFATEKAAAIHHCNGNDFWIVGKVTGKRFHYGYPPDGNRISAWLLTDTGLNSFPVVSAPGYNIMRENGEGYFRFSPDGKFAATPYVNESGVVIIDSTFIEIYQFDNCTGIFSNPITIHFPVAYSLSFSPDSKKLYAGVTREAIDIWGMDTTFLVQYDLSVYDSISIVSSKKIIDSGTKAYAGLQLGIDGKLYVTDEDTSLANYGDFKLGVIINPNQSTPTYYGETIDLFGRLHFFSLPYFPDSYFNSFSYTQCKTGITENITITEKIKLYPNPCNDFLHIDNLPDATQIKIFNFFGELLYKKNTYKSDEIISTGHLSAGIYLIQIETSNSHIINQKFIKQ